MVLHINRHVMTYKKNGRKCYGNGRPMATNFFHSTKFVTRKQRTLLTGNKQ